MFLIDSNQASLKDKIGEKLIDILQEEERVIVTPLEHGDIAFSGRIETEEGLWKPTLGFELKKTPSDVMASLRDGRFMTQLPGMIADYDLAYIVEIGKPLTVNFRTGKIIERRRSKTFDSPFSWKYLNGIYAKFEAAGGLIRHVPDMEHLAALLLSLHHWWKKGDHKEETFAKKRYSFSDWMLLSNPLAEFYERMGIGVQRAITLTEYCPDVVVLMALPQKIIAKFEVEYPGKDGKEPTVRKFGLKSAEKVWNFLHTNHGTGDDKEIRVIT